MENGNIVHVQLDHMVHHASNQIHYRKDIKEKLKELREDGARIWLVLTCKDGWQIIYQGAFDTGAPRVLRSNDWQYPDGRYMRVFDHNEDW